MRKAWLLHEWGARRFPPSAGRELLSSPLLVDLWSVGCACGRLHCQAAIIL